MILDNQRCYYAVIPANVRYDKSLIPNAKLLYGEITALCNEKGYCWATNDYFSQIYSVSKRTIQTWIKSLSDAGYISLEFVNTNDVNKIAVRLIKIVENLHSPMQKNSHPSCTKLHDLHEENFIHNNTPNNTINNSSSQISKKSSDKKNFDKDSDPYLLAKLLESEILKNNPKFPENEKQKQTWAKDFDLMIRRDNISADDIAEVIVWCQQDAFWRSNILSGKKLREKYQQLRMKMENR